MSEDEHPDVDSELPTIPRPADVTGRTIAGYRILQVVGEGGMGVVYEAEQEEPVRRRVALKLIKPGMDTSQVVARFESERQALALMSHPSIASIYDGGVTEDGRPYFAMELVHGEPLTEYCDKNRLTIKERLELFIHVCEGVQHAHQKGIIHRDLKPSNILITIQDGKPVAKIIDFGVAKATSQRLTDKTLYTQLGQWMGTPVYMSPEQAEMTGIDVDTRSDVYSLGVILYELLAGALPFDTTELKKAGFDGFARVLRESEPKKPSTKVHTLAKTPTDPARTRRLAMPALEKELRGDLDWITMKALEKDRNRRYGAASDLAQDIRRHLRNEPVVASPPSAAYRGRKFIRRHRLGVTSAALLVLLLSAFSGAMFVQVRRTARERDKAERLAAFMTDLFKVSDPSEARGNTITAREVLDRGTDRISRELNEDPETKAALIATMGNVYVSLGLYGPATPLLEEALQLRQQLWGQNHPDVGTSLSDLGWLSRGKGDYATAESLFREALAVRRNLGGRNSIEFAESENDLGAILWSKGDYSGAEECFREALDIRRSLLGNRHPSVAKTLTNLGVVRHSRGDFLEAESLYREGLEIKRALYGHDHPDVAASLNNLAALVHERGDLPSAEALYREALSLNIRLLGNEHPEVAGSIRNLAECISDQGDFSEAEALYREALAIVEKAVGPKHPDSARYRALLAGVLLKSGRIHEAEPLARESKATLREELPSDHPEVAVSGRILGLCLVKLGRFGEAETLLLDSYRVLSVKQPDRPSTKSSLEAVVTLYEAWGRPDKAAEYRALLTEAEDGES